MPRAHVTQYTCTYILRRVMPAIQYDNNVANPLLPHLFKQAANKPKTDISEGCKRDQSTIANYQQ